MTYRCFGFPPLPGPVLNLILEKHLWCVSDSQRSVLRTKSIRLCVDIREFWSVFLHIIWAHKLRKSSFSWTASGNDHRAPSAFAHPHQRATLTICSRGLTPNVCHHQFWQTWPGQGGTRNDDTDRPVEHRVLLMQAKGHRLLRGPSVSEGSGERSSMLNYSRALSVFCRVCGCVYPQ